jgi:hypothetical protein
VQIILNMFCQKPLEQVLSTAADAAVAITARVPLAGLLSGPYERGATFVPNDHRNFNRHGEAFHVGETFAGVPFDVGLEAVDRLRPLVPESVPMAQFALPGSSIPTRATRSKQWGTPQRPVSRLSATTCTPRSQRSMTTRSAPTRIIL